ncbi:MAG TPA: hypothetical protein VJR48_06430, partial [Ktedonobacterales bacterium]|nr:hypothetical protein [Ktedonobacterales bacterium]
APGIAALAAIGLTLLWRDYRAAGWHGYLLPAALVVTAVVQGVILADYTGWNGWMTPLIVGGSLLLAALLAWWRYAHASAAAVDAPRDPLVGRLVRSSAVAVVATALGVALLLLGPATWVGVSLASCAGGTLPTAGPSANVAQRGGFGGNGGGPQGFTGDFPNGFVPGGPRNGGFGGFPPAFGEPGNGHFGPRNDGNGGGGAPAGGLANGNGGQSVQVNEQLLAYLEAHRGSARYLLAALNSQTAAPYIIASGQPVIALGGFSGSDQILSLSQLQALVNSGAIRYFLLDGGGGGFGGGNGQLVSWVASSCTQVAASDYGGASSGTLYACTSAG